MSEVPTVQAIHSCALCKDWKNKKYGRNGKYQIQELLEEVHLRLGLEGALYEANNRIKFLWEENKIMKARLS